MLPDGMNHGNISWNYEPSVAWIVEKLVAFNAAHLNPPPPPPSFRPAADGGAMAFFGSGAGRRLTFYLEGTLATAYYAVFTNGTLQGPFFAVANGVPGSTSGALELPVDAKEPSKFFAIGVSDEPIHEGDPLTL